MSEEGLDGGSSNVSMDSASVVTESEEFNADVDEVGVLDLDPGIDDVDPGVGGRSCVGGVGVGGSCPMVRMRELEAWRRREGDGPVFRWTGER